MSPMLEPRSPSHPSTLLNSIQQWSVRIVPADSAKYIATVWNEAHLPTSTVEGLYGRVNMWAPDPMTLCCHIPPFHTDCVQSLTLMPMEKCVPLICVFGEVCTIPAWCIISKYGQYKGDLGYITSFNAQSRVFDILAALWELKPLPQYDDDEMIGQDICAR
ncbi:hypothetical protein J3R83DRAFT_2891 [Lanmaoa asiatica]|nr:hypothetical protein J3R83DRAFT_2891 [Lanmaoa asiatica]